MGKLIPVRHKCVYTRDLLLSKQIHGNSKCTSGSVELFFHASCIFAVRLYVRHRELHQTSVMSPKECMESWGACMEKKV